MTIIVTIIAFLFVLTVLVLVHEWGHFFMAKRAGIKVEEFGFGLPPRIWGKKKGETLYSINALPFGGFVRLYGEDPSAPGVKKSKRSYIGKSLWERFLVVVAGVFMNFVLAFVFLTFAFLVGVKPILFISPEQTMMIGNEDLYSLMDQGRIEMSPGFIVKNIEPGSRADESGFEVGDVIFAVDEREIENIESFYAILNAPLEKDEFEGMTFLVKRDSVVHHILVDQPWDGQLLDIYDIVDVPRLTVSSVKEGSIFAQSGLQPEDVVLEVNGSEVGSIDQFRELVENSFEVELTVFRHFQTISLPLVSLTDPHVVIGKIFRGGTADEVGLQQGDLVVNFQEQPVLSPEDFVEQASAYAGQPVFIDIIRDGLQHRVSFKLNEEGKIGVLLSRVHRPIEDISFYDSFLSSSVIRIDSVRYSFSESLSLAAQVTGRLSLATVRMFGNLIQGFVTGLSVPEGVSGPVGIAQMTFSFVQLGFTPLILFMAFLSLSLGVINLFPFPGLDGGRLLFILLELIFRKPISIKWEHRIHFVGFLILIALILAVTVQDVARLTG